MLRVAHRRCSKASPSPIVIGAPDAVRPVNVTWRMLSRDAVLKTRMAGSEVELLPTVAGV